MLAFLARDAAAGADAALMAAAVVIGIGECVHTAALMPLVADLAPEALRGRYMAAVGLSWWIGGGGGAPRKQEPFRTLAASPLFPSSRATTLGTRLWSASAALTLCASAGAAAAAGVAMLRLDRRLPAGARFTPRPASPPEDA